MISRPMIFARRAVLTPVVLLSFLIAASVTVAGWTQEDLQPIVKTSAVIAQKPGKTKQPMPVRLQKRELGSPEVDPATLQEMTSLSWTDDETESISLEDVFKQALEENPTLEQAKERIKEAELKGKEMRRPGFFFLMLPQDTAALKKAAEENTDSARSLYEAAIQKALLDGAQMHAALTKAYLNKYVHFQNIQQGRAQLKANQERFISGEVNRFEVTQAEISLIDRYQKYLSAHNLYQDASLGLATQLGLSTKEALVPEGVKLDSELGVTALNLLPVNLNAENSAKAALARRPELQALQAQKASLEKLIKAASGDQKDMLESDLRQLELELVKARRLSGAAARQAFDDYALARKSAELANQQFQLANRFLRQLEISQDAGFSSSKDVLDGQVEWAKAKANAVNSMVDYNLSQIKLLHELGMLSENSLKSPLRLDGNLL